MVALASNSENWPRAHGLDYYILLLGHEFSIYLCFTWRVYSPQERGIAPELVLHMVRSTKFYKEQYIAGCCVSDWQWLLCSLQVPRNHKFAPATFSPSLLSEMQCSPHYPGCPTPYGPFPKVRLSLLSVCWQLLFPCPSSFYLTILLKFSWAAIIFVLVQPVWYSLFLCSSTNTCTSFVSYYVSKLPLRAKINCRQNKHHHCKRQTLGGCNRVWTG